MASKSKAPAKPAAKAPAAPKPDQTLALQGALDVISHYLSAPRGPDHLAATLKAAGVTVKDAGLTYAARGAGVTASSTAGVHGALTNWCNAARRALARGGA